jgi:hypothetical protein
MSFTAGGGFISAGTVDLNWHYLVLTSAGANSWVRRDGVDVASGSIGTPGNFVNPVNLCTGYTPANIAEIIVCANLTGSSLLAELEGFLATKWAI